MKRILIVDDEASYRMRLEQYILRKLEYKIEIALDGSKAR